MAELLDELDAANCWCGRSEDECEEAGGCCWSNALGDLKAKATEAESEAATIRGHAQRYFRAFYGPDYLYRAPETFPNVLERWIWAVGAGVPELAHVAIADIERYCAERDARDGEVDPDA